MFWGMMIGRQVRFLTVTCPYTGLVYGWHRGRAHPSFPRDVLVFNGAFASLCLGILFYDFLYFSWVQAPVMSSSKSYVSYLDFVWVELV